MFIQIDLGTGEVGLAEPADCTRFHVEVRGGEPGGGAAAVADALGELGRVGDDPDHVWIDIDGVRGLAAGEVDDSWADEFEGMIGYARSKGWLDTEGQAIQAHLEWV